MKKWQSMNLIMIQISFLYADINRNCFWLKMLLMYSDSVADRGKTGAEGGGVRMWNKELVDKMKSFALRVLDGKDVHPQETAILPEVLKMLKELPEDNTPADKKLAVK